MISNQYSSINFFLKKNKRSKFYWYENLFFLLWPLHQMRQRIQRNANAKLKKKRKKEKNWNKEVVFYRRLSWI